MHPASPETGLSLVKAPVTSGLKLSCYWALTAPAFLLHLAHSVPEAAGYGDKREGLGSSGPFGDGPT